MNDASFPGSVFACEIKAAEPTAKPRRPIPRKGASKGHKKAEEIASQRSDRRPVITGSASRPPNLLIVGASGHVAQAFLERWGDRRAQFGRLVLLDQNETMLKDAYLDHGRLDYEFIHRQLNFSNGASQYRSLLRQHQIDLVLDVTDLDTLPILNATDAAGVSYVNTALNDAKRGVAEVVAALHPKRKQKRKAPHIISSGMNPGVVNIWVWHGYQHYGAPAEVVHFEYDTSMPVAGWRPIITWSRKEFLTEAVWEPTGLVVNGRYKLFPTNSLQHREDLRPTMEPVVRLASYPRGLLVLHEENLKLGRKLGASSKYIYAIHPRTMDYLDELWRKRGRVEITDLELGDNTSVPLTGSDTIGVCLDYPNKRIYYLHSLANSAVTGTNATCAQVAVGIDAALSTLLAQRLSPRIYFASDLYDTVYRDVVFRSLHVEQFVFEKRKNSLILRRQGPVVPARPGKGRH